MICSYIIIEELYKEEAHECEQFSHMMNVINECLCKGYVTRVTDFPRARKA